jgi:murein DD-endopeptidase MepM/ murein hydrolase activator NlpD
VVEAGPLGEYGVALILDHGNGVRSVYAHLDKHLARRGQRVERGQVIGVTGNTGRSSGPHLHYEVRVHGRPVNPRSFLWGR